MDGPLPTVEQLAAAQLRDKIGEIADQLTEFATQLRHTAADVDQVGQPGTGTYAVVARRVQHAYANLQPNLGLDTLTIRAAEADIARAKGE